MKSWACSIPAAQGLLLAVVVIGRRQGLSGGEVGALVVAFGLVLAVWGTLSPSIRAAPNLDELDAV